LVLYSFFLAACQHVPSLSPPLMNTILLASREKNILSLYENGEQSPSAAGVGPALEWTVICEWSASKRNGVRQKEHGIWLDCFRWGGRVVALLVVSRLLLMAVVCWWMRSASAVRPLGVRHATQPRQYLSTPLINSPLPRTSLLLCWTCAYSDGVTIKFIQLVLICRQEVTIESPPRNSLWMLPRPFNFVCCQWIFELWPFSNRHPIMMLRLGKEHGT